jgi:hypothetical protein
MLNIYNKCLTSSKGHFTSYSLFTLLLKLYSTFYIPAVLFSVQFYTSGYVSYKNGIALHRNISDTDTDLRLCVIVISSELNIFNRLQ